MLAGTIQSLHGAALRAGVNTASKTSVFHRLFVFAEGVNGLLVFVNTVLHVGSMLGGGTLCLQHSW
jgi:hypothetical protein